MNHFHVTRFLPLLALLAAAHSCVAGPLAPPAGPVTSTLKTLSEIEPRIAINLANTPGDAQHEYIISQPGSYYLVGNLNIGGIKHAIKVAADNVSIDMNGFSMVCTASSTGTAITTANVAHANIRVTNGVIRGGFQGGITLQGMGHRIERVNIQNTFGDAINLQEQATVRDCSATANSGLGIVCGVQASISGCTVKSNAMGGVSAGNDANVSDCSALFNTGVGISVVGNSSVTNCTAANGSSHGIRADYSCVLRDCIAKDNIEDGFHTSGGCRISDCASSFNDGNGFNINNGTIIAHSCSDANTLDGIVATYGTLILDNNCDQNGTGGSGAGIHVTGNDNRIEGNNCTQADRGIEIGSFGNIIVKNTCATNTTDWVIAANNIFGAIIDRRAPASAAVSGFAAPSTLGSTDPNANFSY